MKRARKQPKKVVKKQKNQNGVLKDEKFVIFELCFRKFNSRPIGDFLHNVEKFICNYHGLMVVLGELKWFNDQNIILGAFYTKKKYIDFLSSTRCTQRANGACYKYKGFCDHLSFTETCFFSSYHLIYLGLEMLILKTRIRFQTCEKGAIKLLELE